MSKGKKWSMPKKYIHKRLKTRMYRCKVGGGGHKKYRYKFFRHKKEYQYLMVGKLPMRKMVSSELWYWDW